MLPLVGLGWIASHAPHHSPQFYNGVCTPWMSRIANAPLLRPTPHSIYVLWSRSVSCDFRIRSHPAYQDARQIKSDRLAERMHHEALVSIKHLKVFHCSAEYYRTRSEQRKALFLVPSVCVFCLCVKYLGTTKTDLRQIYKEYAFGPSLGRVWRSWSKVKVKVTSYKKCHFSALSAACVRFMFCETSLASSFKYFRTADPANARNDSL